jgi:hypothetical protein
MYNIWDKVLIFIEWKLQETTIKQKTEFEFQWETKIFYKMRDPYFYLWDIEKNIYKDNFHFIKQTTWIDITLINRVLKILRDKNILYTTDFEVDIQNYWDFAINFTLEWWVLIILNVDAPKLWITLTDDKINHTIEDLKNVKEIVDLFESNWIDCDVDDIL